MSFDSDVSSQVSLVSNYVNVKNAKVFDTLHDNIQHIYNSIKHLCFIAFVSYCFYLDTHS